MRVPLPPLSELHHLLICDPVAGILYWKAVGDLRRDARFAGREAGHKRADGYIVIGIGSGKSPTKYLRHRIIWAMYHGTVILPDQIDHINQVKGDDGISNLRAATHSDNQRNTRKRVTNTSGITGVHRVQGKWVASIRDNGKRIHLGRFDTLEEAACARKEADMKYGYSILHGTEA